MGRHARPRTPAGRPAAGVVVTLVLAAAVLAGLLVWRGSQPDEPATAATTTCAETTQVRVTVAPELAALTRSLLADPTRLAEPCTEPVVEAVEPLQTVGDLGALDAGALPQVWVPDAVLWAGRTGDAPLEAAGSLAGSPLVLATSRAAVDAEGWTVAPPTWAEALGSGRPVALPDLGGSAEGLLTAGALRSSLVGSGLSEEEAGNALVAAALGAARGTSPTVAQAMQTAAAGGVDAPLVPVTEQQLLAARGGAPSELVAVYPRDGSPSLDHPVLRVGRPAAEEQAAVDAVVTALTSPEAGPAARAAGFRDATGAPPDGAGGGSGVPDAAPAVLSLDSAGLQALFGQLSALARPSRVLAVVDVSTSMSAPAGDGTRATLARDSALSALTLFPGTSALGLWVFAAELDGETDWQELVPIRALDEQVDGVSQREQLVTALDTVPERLTGGGTGLYDTTLAAVRAAREAYNPAAVASVVVITDGTNEDSAGIQLPELLETLTAEADPDRPVKVVAVGLGPDADLDALQQIADVTGGGAYPAVDPEDLQTVLFDAVRRR